MNTTARSYILTKSIVFVGMMGSGKTAIGRLVAKKMGVPFADTDSGIENSERMSISSLFDAKGENYFRERESALLLDLLSGPARAISLGGGGFMQDRNREFIRQRAKSIWLEVDVDLLWSRVGRKTGRPLLKTMDPYGTLVALLSERTPIYEMADIRVRAEEGLSKSDMADKVVAELLAYSETHALLARTGSS